MNPEGELEDKLGLGILIHRLKKDFGLDLSQYNEGFLERRVSARIRMCRMSGYSAYLSLLSKNPTEYYLLLQALSINVTEFFRDPKLYEAIEGGLLSKLLESRQAVHIPILRAWSAGCATGEEPYSLAMALQSALGRRNPPFSYTIYATDVNVDALQFALQGCYSKDKLQKVAASYRRHYFEDKGDNLCVTPTIKSTVRFCRESLLDRSSVPVVDMILCRNVMIYFSRETRTRTLGLFHSRLMSDGFLILGSSEVVLQSNLFSVVDPALKIYKKK